MSGIVAPGGEDVLAAAAGGRLGNRDILGQGDKRRVAV